MNQEAEPTSAPGRDHSNKVNVRKEIEQLRALIKEELKHIASNYQSTHEIAKTKERAVEEELAQNTALLQSEKQYLLKLRELENIAKNLRTTYDDNASFLQRDIEQLQQQSMPTSGARIISLALPPLRKSYPKTSLLVGGATLAGLILGFAIGFFRDITDRTCRSREQIETILDAPCITIVPRLGANFQKQALPSLANATPTSPEPFLSRFSEAMQTISLILDPAHAASQIVGVTSALPNEGKSTIIAYLARTLARSGKRVILVDCDLRGEKLSEVFADQSRVGLRDVAMGEVSIQTAIKHHDAGFAFLSAGTGACSTHLSRIFAMPKTCILFEELRKSFDYILLDLPSLGPVTDVVATGKFIDFYLFVIKWGETQTRVVQQALDKT